MAYNFDEIIDRKDTSCYKYDLLDKFYKRNDLLPMWVADMDFRTPDFITDAIRERLEHPVLGYSFHSESQRESIQGWIDRRHSWKIKDEWIGFTPGVVPALNLAVLAYTNPGDKIVIQTPVYFPFYSAVTEHGRELVLNPLRMEGDRYAMDLEHLESVIDDKTKMIILCSPHNPAGNVWRREELSAFAELCERHNLLILSDEIHADIVFTGNKHIPTAMLSEATADRTITLMAPSKTFNFAGLATSYYIISNPKLFKKMEAEVGKLHINQGNILGNVAMEAAYTHGDTWLTELITYLEGNIELVNNFINSKMPGVKVIPPEATFLVWLDFKATNIADREVRKLLLEDARVALSNGILFGKDGKDYQRINVGCPRSVLQQGLEQMAMALKGA